MLRQQRLGMCFPVSQKELGLFFAAADLHGQRHTVTSSRHLACAYEAHPSQHEPPLTCFLVIIVMLRHTSSVCLSTD